MAKKKRDKKKLTRVEFLRNKFVGQVIGVDSEETISNESFEKILEADPTKNKKYISWMLDIHSKGRLEIEDLVKAKEYLTYILKYKHKLKDSVEIEYNVTDENGDEIVEKKTINPRNASDYWDLHQMFNQIEFLMVMDEEELQSESALIKGKKEKDVRIVFEDENWKIVIPLSQEMANLYGKGTQWCTTSSKSNGHGFIDYTVKDYPGSSLYIIINKKAGEDERKFHKFQFHYESEQYMDANNGPINLSSFLTKNPDVLKGLTNSNDSFSFFIKMKFNVKGDGENVIDGDVDLSNFDFESHVLIKNLVVNGDARFSKSKIKIIDGLKVSGDLILVDSMVEKIRGHLEVGKSLFAQDSELSELPNDTKIGAVGRFTNCLSLNKLPLGITVGGHFYLSGTKIEEITKKNKVHVTGNLYIHKLGIPTSEVHVEHVRDICNCNQIN